MTQTWTRGQKNLIGTSLQHAKNKSNQIKPKTTPYKVNSLKIEAYTQAGSDLRMNTRQSCQ